VNLHSCSVADRDWAVAERYFTEGAAYCDDHDITTYSIFLRSERTSVLERTGRWDEAVAICLELLQGGPSPNIRLCPLCRLGTIRARRGEPGVWECLDEAIEYADGAGESQSIVPVRLARAEAFWLDGNLADGRREAELADDAADGCDGWDRGAVAVWLQRTETVPASALVVLIGAVPHTDWLPPQIGRDEHGFIVTGSDLADGGSPAASWTLPRPPVPLETSLPGVFTAGDVRHGSVKRVASAVGEGSIAATQMYQYLQQQARSS
jgi:hypothetical protein